MSGFSATSTASVQNARNRLKKFLRTVETVPMDVLEAEAERIHNEAVAETPYGTGKLENSIYVRPSRSKTTFALVAGANARSHGFNYAGIQHENTKYEHAVKGKAFYIRDPFNRGIRRIKRKLREKVKY